MDRQQNTGISQFSFALPHAPPPPIPRRLCAHSSVYGREGGKRANCFQAKAPLCNFALEKGFASGETRADVRKDRQFIHLKATESKGQTGAASTFFSRQAYLISAFSWNK